MKIDFHNHGKLAKTLPFSPEYIDWIFAEAGKEGLDAICLTEHYNTVGFEEIYNHITDTLPRRDDCFVCGQLKIFPGMEIDIAEGGHILAIGKVEDILSLNRLLDPYKEKGRASIPLEKLLDLVSGYDLLLGAAHPFRKGSMISALPVELLKRLNFIELNGKDVVEYGRDMNEKVYDLAERARLPVAAGSDTHQTFQSGCIFSLLPDSTDIESLRRDLGRNTDHIIISDHAGLKVKTAGVLKRALKEIHALGGDYVSILFREKE